uniref:CCHC-type domain-containing protein n=1 Tax=Trichogramma kaykai TaxID=54128 RepID=A0ABD2WYZ7_9HYME
MAQIPTLEPFNVDGDTTSVGLQWEKWKRALDMYFVAASISSPIQRRATLLHVGGLSLQEIYYNIPGAHVECIETTNASGVTTATDVYDVAITKLNDYFSPKQSSVYERHIFRSLRQEPDEKFEKFLVRLRHQAAKCNFTKTDDNIIDQIVEKCVSPELRKKVLQMGESITLNKVITEATTLEVVERQITHFNVERKNQPFQPIHHIKTQDNHMNLIHKVCTRCGSDKDLSDHNNCPAKGKKCLKCGYTGHFRSQCKTRTSKRKQTSNTSSENKKFKSVNYNENVDRKIDYSSISLKIIYSA